VRYSGRTIFQNGPLALRLVLFDVSEGEINFMTENAIPRNTKHASKFGMTSSKIRCENCAKYNKETIMPGISIII